jgi:hypothetical protein
LLINTTHPITSLNRGQRITLSAKPKDKFPQPARATSDQMDSFDPIKLLAKIKG